MYVSSVLLLDHYRERTVGGYIPAGTKDQEIRKRRCRIARWRREHTEDRWINMVNGDRADVNELR